MMRFALVSLALIAATAVPAGAAKKPSCARTGDTVLRNSTARIYDVGEKVYACHLSTRKRTFLTRYRSADDSLEDLRGFLRGRLAGRYVAFGDEFGCDRLADCGGSVRLVDTRTGEDVNRVLVILLAGKPNSGAAPTLPALHLKSDGSAALIIGPSSDARWEVWRMNPDSSNRLDAGEVDPQSLATNRSRIYWMRDGQPFSATW